MKRNLGGALLLVASTGALAAAPDKNDYAQGIRVDSYSARPLVEAQLPDEVYRTITRADLGDVRVFNADGMAVPHAFCPAPQATAGSVSKEYLPLYEAQGATHGASNGTRVEVQTAGGTEVKVREGGTTTTAATLQTTAYFIDARSITDALRSIEFDWSSPDGASEAQVRIEASEDLDGWRVIVPASTLLQVTQGDQQLRRQTVPLPERAYQYLRVMRTDRGPPLRIDSVMAERVTPPTPIEPVWFAANAQPAVDGESRFDSGRLAPVTHARLVLPQENMSLRVSIDSRVDEKSPWHGQWSGEAYSITNDGEQRISPPAQFTDTADRYWRVSPAKAGDTFNPVPTLELGYRPAVLRFMAQGAGPYTLAFGSRRAAPAAAQPCDSLLTNLGTRDKADLIGDGTVGPAQALGGDTAFKPLPQKTPVRMMVLWGVLVAGAGLLVAMALSLLKRVTQPN